MRNRKSIVFAFRCSLAVLARRYDGVYLSEIVERVCKSCFLIREYDTIERFRNLGSQRLVI